MPRGMGILIDLDEPDAPANGSSSTTCNDDLFNGTGMQRGDQDLIALYDDLLDLNTPPSTPPKAGKQPSTPSTPLLTPEQALRLFEPPELQPSPELTPVNYKDDVDPSMPLVELDSFDEPVNGRPPHAAPPVPRAPSASYSSSQSSSRPSSQPTQLSSTRVSSVSTRSTQVAARAPPFVPSPAETPVQARPFSARPAPAQQAPTAAPPASIPSSTRTARPTSIDKGKNGFAAADRQDPPKSGSPGTALWAEPVKVASVARPPPQTRAARSLPPIPQATRAAPPHTTKPAAPPPASEPTKKLTRISNRLSDSGSELTEPESATEFFYAPTPAFMAELSKEAYVDKAAYELYLRQPSPRMRIPLSFVNYTRLEESLLRSWAKAEPSPTQLQLIKDLLATLTMGLERWELKSGLTNGRACERVLRVDPFGSVAWGGSTGSKGDLDLVIIDKRLPEGYHPSLWRINPVGDKYDTMRHIVKSKKSLYNVYFLKQKLSEIAGVSDCQTVRGASVPIVKFKYRDSIECDINVNDMGGWNNSKLILAYCELSPFVLRPLIHFLKLWAARFNLNDPSASRGPRTFSSYCLTLITIAYLQAVGHLPNLQQGVKVPQNLDPANVNLPNTVWVNWGRRQGAAAHIWFRPKPLANWVQEDITLGDALVGFFAFLKTSFDASAEILSVLNGGVIKRASEKGTADERRRLVAKEVAKLSPENANIRLGIFDDNERANWHEGMGTGKSGVQPLAWTTDALIVQDPFIWEKNCAAGISSAQIDTFFNTVSITYLKLIRGRQQGITELLR